MSDISSQIEKFYLTGCDSGFHTTIDSILYFGKKNLKTAQNEIKSHKMMWLASYYLPQIAKFKFYVTVWFDLSEDRDVGLTT
jgi:GH25 family lysozyme M1 (1,4-beta-N-acetylmuramidase)